MIPFILKRLGLAIVVAFLASAVTFLLLRLAADPAQALAGEGATAADIENISRMYGFDQPLLAQYWTWLTRALAGDFGMSIYLKSPVIELIADRAPVTVALALSSICLALVVSIPLGVVAALRPNTFLDRFALGTAVVGQAMPSFFFALLLILVFGVHLQILPISGSESWLHFVLPSIVLGYYAMPALMRLTRGGMLDVLGSDYIRTARAKGLRAPVVLFKHALRNAIVSVVAVAAVQLGFMLGGSVVIESIFSLNGLGRLAYQSIQRADFDTIQAIILMIAGVYVLLTFAADVLNAWLDPRIRVS